MFQYIIKRDGKIVPFNISKISGAIYKVTEAIGEPNIELAKNLAEKVARELAQKIPEGKNPNIEQIQDIVEKVLMNSGYSRMAKSYILYRQKRAEIRAEKKQILDKQEIDEVDKQFDINALRVLRSRYLKKDEKGKVLESPKELLTRVAIHAALPSLLYDEKVFQKKPTKKNAANHKCGEFNSQQCEGQFTIGSFTLNQFHLEALKKTFDRLAKQGYIKIPFAEFQKLLQSGYFGKYEKEIVSYYELMCKRYFMPNTPTLANFGTYLGMGSACFVLGIDDSIESIMETLKEAAIIFKCGGGVGYNFSKLRPENDFVKTTGGVASGPISFMTLFDRMTEVIKQGGIRRGANMGILNINHPDIEKFITAKKGNAALKNFNISVLVSKDFMEHLEKNKPFPLVNPKSKKIAKYIDSPTLFNLITYQAWESAEPGIIFEDYLNRHNPFLKSLGPLVSTNPCVVGDTLVAVADGRNYVPIKQLAEEAKDVPVYCYGNKKVQIKMGRAPRKTRNNAPVWKVTIDDGSYFIATEDHKFRGRDNQEIQLKNLKPETKLMPFYKFQYLATGKRTPYWGITLNNGERAAAEHRLIAEFHLGKIIKKYPAEVVHHKNCNGLDNHFSNLEIMSQNEHNKFHQIGEKNVMKGKWWTKLSETEKEKYREKMRLATSGENNGMFGKKHKLITLEKISEKLKNYYSNDENIIKHRMIMRQIMANSIIRKRISKAMTRYGITTSQCLECGKIFTKKENKKKQFCSKSCKASFVNRRRNTENLIKTLAAKRMNKRGKLYDLGAQLANELKRIPTYLEFKKWAYENRMSGDVRSAFGGYKNFKEEIALHNHKVISVEFYGYQDVYNITVDDFHTVAYITNPNKTTKFSKRPLISGIITSQCGELPLYPYESCNLGSINLSSFVKSKPTNGRKKEVEFDWNEFRETIYSAVQFLDNVIDINKYPLPQIEDTTLKTRKIGLGVMGLADILLEMEIPYNSDEGLQVMEKIMEFLNYHSKIKSVELAKKRGIFPLYKDTFYSEGKLPFSGSETGPLQAVLQLSQRLADITKIFFDPSRFLNWKNLISQIKKFGIRNSHTTVIAPTGSISMIAGCSSGMEPVYSIIFEKQVPVGSFYYVNPIFEQAMMREGLFDEQLIRDVSEAQGSIQSIAYMPQKFQKTFVTALDIKVEDHIKALAACQKWTDLSISKTINFPSSATIEDIKKAYLSAYDMGCKDITVFRDKSLETQVLVAGGKKTDFRKEIRHPDKEKRAENKEEEKKKTGEIKELISLRDVKAKGLSIYQEAGATEKMPPLKESLLNSKTENQNGIEKCPSCQMDLVEQEGCKTCPSCGWGMCI